MAQTFDRFSKLYIQRGAALRDSARARTRFVRLVSDVGSQVPSSAGSQYSAALAAEVQRESGVTIPSTGWGYDVSTFLQECELRDFLDCITIAYRVALNNSWTKAIGPHYLQFVQRIFDEENLSYRIDAQGVVHFRVDQEYEANVSSAITALESPRYAAARGEFQRARDAMSKATPDAVDATRAIFAASESVFKVVTSSGASLDEGEVRKTLTRFVDRQMSEADSIAKSAASRFVIGFADWVNACHPYRHGHDQPDAPVPPIALAVALMSAGASYIRWLATLSES